MPTAKSRLADILKKNQTDLLDEWLQAQLAATTRRGLIQESDLREQSRRFLALLADAAPKPGADIQAPEWRPMRDLLSEISRARNVGIQSIRDRDLRVLAQAAAVCAPAPGI